MEQRKWYFIRLMYLNMQNGLEKSGKGTKETITTGVTLPWARVNIVTTLAKG